MNADESEVPSAAVRALVQRLDDQGALDFRRSRGSLSKDILFIPVMGAGIAGMTLTHAWFLLAMFCFAALLVVPQLLEAWIAPGPALRVDGTGVHLSRWREPLTIAWHDLHIVHASRRTTQSVVVGAHDRLIALGPDLVGDRKAVAPADVVGEHGAREVVAPDFVASLPRVALLA